VEVARGAWEGRPESDIRTTKIFVLAGHTIKFFGKLRSRSSPISGVLGSSGQRLVENGVAALRGCKRALGGVELRRKLSVVRALILPRLQRRLELGFPLIGSGLSLGCFLPQARDFIFLCGDCAPRSAGKPNKARVRALLRLSALFAEAFVLSGKLVQLGLSLSGEFRSQASNGFGLLQFSLGFLQLGGESVELRFVRGSRLPCGSLLRQATSLPQRHVVSHEARISTSQPIARLDCLLVVMMLMGERVKVAFVSSLEFILGQTGSLELVQEDGQIPALER